MGGNTGGSCLEVRIRVIGRRQARNIVGVVG
jgi:hypothetical protein